MKRMPDRRASKRFALKLNLSFTVFKDRKPVARGHGTIKNLSTSGILFATDTFIRQGSILHLEVDWPVGSGQQENPQARVEWHVDGVCVRSSRQTAAVKIMRQRLVRELAEEKVMVSGASEVRDIRHLSAEPEKPGAD